MPGFLPLGVRDGRGDVFTQKHHDYSYDVSDNK